MYMYGDVLRAHKGKKTKVQKCKFYRKITKLFYSFILCHLYIIHPRNYCTPYYLILTTMHSTGHVVSFFTNHFSFCSLGPGVCCLLNKADTLKCNRQTNREIAGQ